MTPELQGRTIATQVSPEVRAERRALNVRLEVEHEPDLVIINSRHSRFRYLPFVDGRAGGESWVPKYIPETGEVYITRWNDPTRTSVSPDGKKVRFVPVPRGTSYIVWKKPDYIRGEVDLTRIPERWKVLKIIPQKHGDIESALRQQDEVSHDYTSSGPEYARVRDISSEIRGLAVKFIGRGVTDDNLPKLQAEVNEVLDANGLLRPSDETLREIADKLTRAATRDSLGRINSGRARYILASAYVSAAMREVTLRHSGEKAVRIYSLLLIEREIERSNLLVAKELVDALVGLDPNTLRDRIFDYEVPQNIPDSEVTRFRNDCLSQITFALRSVRLNPYFLVARMSDLILMGNDLRFTVDAKALTNLLKDAGMEWLPGFTRNASVDRAIRQKDPFYAKGLMKIISSLIGSCLQDDRLHDIKVF